jgi:hypothetical protein
LQPSAIASRWATKDADLPQFLDQFDGPVKSVTVD